MDQASVRYRLALGLAAVAACKLPDKQPGLGSGSPDAGVEVDAAEDLDAGAPDPDAAIDAAPDADPTIPDTTPPSLVGMTPAAGASVWLQSPIRLLFDEPLMTASGTATVTIGGTPTTATVTFEAPRTLVVKLDAAARGVGALDLHVDVQVADPAGNIATPVVDATLMVPAWHALPIDRGIAMNAPALAASTDGRVLAAWTVGAIGQRRLAVSELGAQSWTNLGATLGTNDVGSTAVAITADGTPVVAWTEGGIAHVATWSGSAWTELASPGSASAVSLAVPPTGSPIIALFGASISVYELAGGAWQQLGTTLTPSSAFVGEPVVAAPAASKPVIGWIDSDNVIRVYRLDADWTAFAPIEASVGSRMNLAARGQTVAIAWDAWAGSFGVLAAIAPGGATTFTRVGKPLDIDIGGDARAPAIALDASGAPIVAWTELVETAYRGALARWSGSTWTIVGGTSWLDSSSVRPGGTRLVLGAGGAPIVATNAGSDIQVVRHNGPRTAAVGIATRAPLTGCAFNPAAPPALLSQTGCFDLATAGKPVAHAGLVPFDVVAELWSDGAKKRRWVALPEGTSMTLGGNGAWVAPTGTILIKEFALETTPGNPATRRVVETRFLVNDATLGWQGFSYRWNTQGTDASLLNDGQFVVGWTLDNGSTHNHVYPSRAHCRSCHGASTGPVLGLRPEQLARWNDYGGVIADQLATLTALGIGPSSAVPAFTAPHDPGATAERRMRGYMAANCAHCHNPQNITIKDLRYATPLASTKLCETIVPGSPSQSVVYQRVTSRPGMPPLGTLMVDPLAQDLLGTWITGMTSCP